MLPRLFTICIIVFWLVMTGLLMQSLWFPADSRLAKVNPGAVLQLVAARGEPSTLDIYDDRVIIGHLTVESSNYKLSDHRKINLRITGRILLDSPGLTGSMILVNSSVDLDREGNLFGYKINLTTGKGGFSLTLSQLREQSPLRILLKQGRTVLMDTSAVDDEALLANPLVAMVIGSMGGALPELKEIRQQAESQAAGMVLEARQGEFDLKGESRKGFVLRYGKPGQPGFRVCVENTGEIVRVETPTTWNLLTESLRPANAPYR